LVVEEELVVFHLVVVEEQEDLEKEKMLLYVLTQLPL
jgi:hypothetical protein